MPRLALLLVLLLCPPLLAEETIDFSLTEEIDNYLQKAEHGPAPLRSDWNAAPVFGSPFGQYRIHLRARFLWDTMWRTAEGFESEYTEDYTYIRQLRFGIDGHIHHAVPFNLEVEFTNTQEVRLRDAWIGWESKRDLGTIMAGHMREVFSIDGVTPVPFLAHLERATPTRAFALGRNAGVRAENAILDRRLTWVIGLYKDSDNLGNSIGSGDFSVTARITGLPIRNSTARERLHLGFGVTYREPPNDLDRFRARPGVSDGPRFVDTDEFAANRDRRINAEFAWFRGPLTIQSEYFLAQVNGEGTDASFWGWYVWASYWLTGERRNYNQRYATYGRMRPKRPFHDGHGGWGAFELTLRYDYTDLTDGGIQGGMQDLWTLGLNWHSTANTRVVLNLLYMDVEEGPLGSGTTLTLAVRFQLDY